MCSSTSGRVAPSHSTTVLFLTALKFHAVHPNLFHAITMSNMGSIHSQQISSMHSCSSSESTHVIGAHRAQGSMSNNVTLQLLTYQPTTGTVIDDPSSLSRMGFFRRRLLLRIGVCIRAIPFRTNQYSQFALFDCEDTVCGSHFCKLLRRFQYSIRSTVDNRFYIFLMIKT